MQNNFNIVLQFDPGKLVSLSPVFKSDGTITAGNASSISDGAAALLLTSTEYAEKHGLPILAHIRGFFDAEQVFCLMHSFFALLELT
jgi:acetyl-CoA acetyltransferase